MQLVSRFRFADPEYFDGGLLRIFGTWQRTGDVGTYMHFTVTADEAGPITYQDVMRMAEAEKYLQETGYFTAPDPAHV